MGRQVRYFKSVAKYLYIRASQPTVCLEIIWGPCYTDTDSVVGGAPEGVNFYHLPDGVDTDDLQRILASPPRLSSCLLSVILPWGSHSDPHSKSNLRSTAPTVGAFRTCISFQTEAVGCPGTS